VSEAMTETVKLGPKSDLGHSVEITRGFEDGTEDYTTTAVKYHCQGVDSVDVDDPWQIGGGKLCHIHVNFVNGESVYMYGVITDVGIDG